jgi:putative transposase
VKRTEAMPNYKRYYAPGHSVFITLVTFRRRPLLVNYIEQWRKALSLVQTKHPFRLSASVVLPDHCHFLMELPEGDGDFSARIGLFKAAFSRSLPKNETISSASRARRREREIWQRRFWEHTTRDEQDFQRHFDYIHFNPVKHGYVSRCIDWPYSSFGRCVRMGIYPADWGNIEPAEIMDLKTGE